MDNAVAETEITGPQRPETERNGLERPETEIHGSERLEPNPTLLLDGIAIPTDDIKLIYEDEIASYANENPLVANTQDQEVNKNDRALLPKIIWL